MASQPIAGQPTVADLIRRIDTCEATMVTLINKISAKLDLHMAAGGARPSGVEEKGRVRTKKSGIEAPLGAARSKEDKNGDKFKNIMQFFKIQYVEDASKLGAVLKAELVTKAKAEVSKKNIKGATKADLDKAEAIALYKILGQAEKDTLRTIYDAARKNEGIISGAAVVKKPSLLKVAPGAAEHELAAADMSPSIDDLEGGDDLRDDIPDDMGGSEQYSDAEPA